jgi:hypothetical protein
MIVFHGTTDIRARRIAAEGFMPRKPSRRVWFAASRAYAMGRAKTQARRSHARAVVLTCEIDLADLRRKVGAKRIRHVNGIIAVDGTVAPTVLRSGGEAFDQPTTPKDLAAWANRVLGLKSYKGVPQTHPGLLRLSRWVVNRTQGTWNRGIRRTELLHMARQWLPEFFLGVEIDPESLLVIRKSPAPHAAQAAGLAGSETAAADEPEAMGPREAEALELLESPGAKARARGLAVLADLGDPDLFEWCAMYLDDESVDVRLAALRAMLQCDDIDPGLLAGPAGSADNRIRGAAIAALARHEGPVAADWFERGLKDPSPCVRLATAAVLSHLDPAANRRVFQIALYDPNPQVCHLAEKLVAGKGYPRITWGRRGPGIPMPGHPERAEAHR